MGGERDHRIENRSILTFIGHPSFKLSEILTGTKKRKIKVEKFGWPFFSIDLTTKAVV